MPKVSVVMLHHEPKNDAYVHLALESIRRQDMDMEVIVVDSTDNATPYPTFVTPIYVSHSMGSAVAANLGVKASSEESKYIFFCNDDVVLGHDALRQLVYSMDTLAVPAIMNSYSNTDCGIYYHCPIFINHKEFPRQFKIEDTTKEEQEAMMSSAPYGRPVLLAVPFVCFYATLMHRKTWTSLGGLDEFYESGPDDRDFCLRAAQKGIPSLINLRPNIWHFGGQTIATKDPEAVAANRIKNAEYFEKKFGQKQY